MQNMVQPANANTALVAVCDIWKKRRDTYPAEAEKLYGLRIFDPAHDVHGRLPAGTAGEVSAQDLGLPVLLVSQFTLYADTRKGRRPSWSAAAPGDVAEPIVEACAAHLRSIGATVPQGVFGADMQVALVNDGPMTIVLELPVSA